MQPYQDPFKRTKEAFNAGEIAKNIDFGNEKLTNYKVNKLVNPAIEKVRKASSVKPIFEPKIEDLAPIYAYWPMLDNKARKMTLDNYRLEAAKINLAIEEMNIEIDTYNAQVRLFCAGELTEIQKTFSDLFLKNIKEAERKKKNGQSNPKFSSSEYNQLVEAFNNERGMLVEKRKEQTLKYATFQHFDAILHLYSKQLAKFTTEYIKLATTELQTVRPVEINAEYIRSLERNLSDDTFVYSLPVCNATIRRQRKILEKVGILTNYKFQGHLRGVKMNISSKILVLFDAKTGKYTNAENQSVSPETWKEFPHENKVLQELSITINKTENSKADFPVLGTASPDLSFVFYGNIPAQGEKSKLGGGEKSVKVSETLSEKLQELTLADTNFAARLANGEYFNHKRIDKVHLYQEATYGTLIREEFLQVIKHEFFKNLSKIYRQSTPFAGSYQKAMNEFEDRFYVNNGNGKFLVRKEVMVDMLQKYLWMVNKANNWFAKTGFTRPLNPHDYLDRTRTHKKEIGFDYLQKAHAKHLKELENKPLQAKKAAKNAELRKKQIDYATRFNQKMNAFKANRITVDELIDYVDKNLPPVFMQNLSDMLIKEMSYSQSKYDC
jgi:hypothetical protein